MAQETKIIDIRRSYIPIDPNAFPPTDHDTEAEDKPEPRIPIVAYDGYNFMPTPQGYSSFFGINSTLGISSLVTSGGTGKVDDLFMIQTNQLQNILVALCDDGIWTKSASSSGNWTHVITLSPPASGLHLQWSKCVIENVIYIYRQGNASVYQAGPANGYIFTGFVPSTINMAGQLGIFKAGGRLGFWDSENSTAWAALGEPTDATPDTKTLAGSTIFQDIVGKIVVVLQHGNGFIIYCTKSIVLVTRNLNSPLIWAGQSIFNSNGISYREEVCFAEPDTKHYAFTTQGVVEIVNGKVEFVIPEVATYLKEKRQPVYIKILNGRYLFFPILNPYYFVGIAHFITESFSAQVFTFQTASRIIEDYESGNGNACGVFNTINGSQDTIYIFDILGFTAYNQANSSASVPIFEDHLSINIPIADMEAFKATGVGGFGNADYFDNTGFTLGGIPKITSGNESFIPTKGPSLVSAYPGTRPIEHIEANENSFYWKQDWAWFYEQRLFDSWKTAISRKVHDNVFKDDGVVYDDNEIPATVSSATTPFITGPFIDLSFFSESNKYYGLSASRKSAWLQRSLTRGISVKVNQIIDTNTENSVEMPWAKDDLADPGHPDLTYPTFATEALLMTGQAAVAAHLVTLGFTTVVFVRYENQGEFGYPINPRSVRMQFTSDQGGIAIPYFPYDPVADVTLGLVDADMIDNVLTVNTPVWRANNTRLQKFSKPEFVYNDYAVCTVKNLGFTKIKGHGHYTLLGAFVIDDSTPEAADYIDQCTLNPTKRNQPFLLGRPTNNDSLSCGDATTTIDGETYTYPPSTVVIPGGTILLQEGSIEPIYSTFLGAFVYDTQYKKWGKMKQNYKQMLDYFPVNNVAGDAPIPYDTFLPKCAILLESGSIALFDQFPTDSRIIFGKVGMYRKGFTDCQEVRIQNRTPLSGSVTVEGSLDGKNVESSITHTQLFADATQVTANYGLSARWFNIIVEGNYDITAMEMRITKKGKR